MSRSETPSVCSMTTGSWQEVSTQDVEADAAPQSRWRMRMPLVAVSAALLAGTGTLAMLGLRRGVLSSTEVAGQGPEELWANNLQRKLIWEPAHSDEAMQLKVLTYNLEWWKLFGKEGGRGGMAGQLIARHNSNPPFDFMGFQECEDPWRVLTDGGMLQDFEPFVSEHSIAMAYNKKLWKLLAHGNKDVAKDVPGQFSFGFRGAQWMRLQRINDTKTVFFLNHHGPLPINSGGQWGWHATAHNLLKLIQLHGKKGDAVIVTGDFNSDRWSKTVQELKKHLRHVYSGSFFQGIDNVFSNIGGKVMSTQNMGKGGSDHDALNVVLQWGGPQLYSPSEIRTMGHGKVGIIDVGVRYEAGDGWSKKMDGLSLKTCIEECRQSLKCHVWSWQASNTSAGHHGHHGDRHHPSVGSCILRHQEAGPKERAKSSSAYSGLVIKEGSRGKCKCSCGWATDASVCKLDDGSCCWMQCCGRFVHKKSHLHELHV